MKEKLINKKITFALVAIFLLVLIVLGSTVAYFMAQASTDIQTVTTGTLTMGFTDGDVVNATNMVPINDSDIKTDAASLPFSVTNTGENHIKLTIKLTDIVISDSLKNVDFRWGLYNADTNKGISFGIFKNAVSGGEEIIYRDVVLDAGSATKNYILRVWLHETGAVQNSMMGQSFSAKVTVTGEAIEYTDESCFKINSNGVITDYMYMETIENGEPGKVYLANNCPTNVVIPRTINGTSVTGIGYAFYSSLFAEGKGITSVIIPDSVTEIGEGAFPYNLLTHITIPESVVNINNYFDYGAFSNNQLTSIFLPEGINFNGNDLNWLGPFSNNKLTTLVVPQFKTSNDIGVFSNNQLTDVVLMEGTTKLSYYIFGNNNNLTSIEIPSSITSISEGAFPGSSNLTEIIVRGKSSLADFTDSTGLTPEGLLPDSANIIFRP